MTLRRAARVTNAGGLLGILLVEMRNSGYVTQRYTRR